MAEDNATNAAIIRAILADQDYTVDIKSDAQTMIEAYERRQPDLMIMDAYLPDMTGTEAARRIRAIEELERRDPVPIIAATASTLPEDRAACIESGMDDFITKPLNKAQLQAKLRYWMGRRAELAVAG